MYNIRNEQKSQAFLQTNFKKIANSVRVLIDIIYNQHNPSKYPAGIVPVGSKTPSAKAGGVLLYVNQADKGFSFVCLI